MELQHQPMLFESCNRGQLVYSDHQLRHQGCSDENSILLLQQIVHLLHQHQDAGKILANSFTNAILMSLWTFSITLAASATSNLPT